MLQKKDHNEIKNVKTQLKILLFAICLGVLGRQPYFYFKRHLHLLGFSPYHLCFSRGHILYRTQFQSEIIVCLGPGLNFCYQKNDHHYLFNAKTHLFVVERLGFQLLSWLDVATHAKLKCFQITKDAQTL